MQIMEQIKALSGLLKRTEKELTKTTTNEDLIAKSKEVATLKLVLTNLCHQIGILTEEEKAHERQFNGGMDL
jgi:hypothetical protein